MPTTVQTRQLIVEQETEREQEATIVYSIYFVILSESESLESSALFTISLEAFALPFPLVGVSLEAFPLPFPLVGARLVLRLGAISKVDIGVVNSEREVLALDNDLLLL